MRNTEDMALGRENDPFIEKLPAPAANSPLNFTFQISILNTVLGELSDEELDVLSAPESIGALMKGVQGKFGANQAAKMFLTLINRKGEAVFMSYSRALLKELKSCDYEQHRPLLIQLKRLICNSPLDSSNTVLQGLFDVLLSQLTYIRATESVLNFIHRLTLRHKSIKQWVYEHIAQLAPVMQWKQRYQTWSSQNSNGLYLTKVYSALSSFTEYHPSPHLILKLTSLLSCKVPDMPKDQDSDDDLYEAPLRTGSVAEYGPKDDTNYKVEVVQSFQTGYYVRYHDYESERVFFLSADDDRLMPFNGKPHH